MADKRIIIYPEVRKEIRLRRKDKSINCVDLSIKIGKSAGWLSFVENGKIESILYEDLLSLFMNLLNPSEGSAETYIEGLYTNIEKNRKENELYYYKNPNDFFDCISVAEKIHNHLYRIINTSDKKLHKVLSSFSRIDKNFSIEPTFTLEIISLPIFRLSVLDVKKKQEFLYALNDLIKDYSEGKR